MTEDTIFDRGILNQGSGDSDRPSCSLYEQGKLSTSTTRLRMYLPEFAVNRKQDITIRQLLTHYSGLPPDRIAGRSVGKAKQEGLRRANAMQRQ